MIYNYFQIAVRNILKNKTHTIINVMGLTLGIATTFLIALYIQGELDYDRFHDQSENLYRISWEDDNPQTRTPHPMAQALVQDFPEVQSAVSLSPLWAPGLTRETHSFRNPERNDRYDEKNILAVDTTFFDVFSFPMVKGNPKEALKKINGVLLSESTAKKYFGDDDAIGKHLSIDGDAYLVEVTGVFKDVPEHSHFHFDFLVSYLREKSYDPEDEYYSWKDFGHFNYVRLKPGTDAKALEAKVMSWSRKYINFSDEDFNSYIRDKEGFKIRPITDIHLNSRLRWELEANGNIEYIYILGAAGLLTLIIACINFMNLTTARSAERAKEIGVRKTLGAFRSQLSIQFLTESVAIALIAVILSIFVLEITLPFFNITMGVSLHLEYGTHLPILTGFAIFIGIISGFYPALYLSATKPHTVLKGKLIQSQQGSRLRNGLIVFQFCMSLILISASVIVFHQLQFLKDKSLGFDKEEVIVIPVKQDEGFDRFEALKNEMLRIEGVKSVSASSNIPGRQFNQHPVAAGKYPDDEIGASEAFVDYDFFETMNIQLYDGRLFRRDNISDTAAAFILNETAARQLYGEDSGVGQELIWDRDEDLIKGTVIGVVKDFHFQSLHEPIRPLMFTLTERDFNHILIKLDTKSFDRTIAAIEKVYKNIEPYYAFEFAFLEDGLNEQYAAEERTGSLLGGFSSIAIIIACFGLFGISLLTFNHKVKEISIRKVLGATSMNLLALIVGNFTRLIVLAIVVAVPVVWWIMDNWLDNFSYQTTIDPWVFVISGVSLIVVAWLTLSYFTVKASQLNPAETLKNE